MNCEEVDAKFESLLRAKPPGTTADLPDFLQPVGMASAWFLVSYTGMGSAHWMECLT
jgi:hypothetical protein